MSQRPTRGSRAAPGRAKALQLPLAPRHDDQDGDSESEASVRAGPSRTKRHTVRKNPEQVARLTEEYAKEPRPTKDARLRLANEIGLDERIVTTWFRDMRSQQKKKRMAAALESGGVGPMRNIGDRRASTRARATSPALGGDGGDEDSDGDQPKRPVARQRTMPLIEINDSNQSPLLIPPIIPTSNLLGLLNADSKPPEQLVQVTQPSPFLSPPSLPTGTFQRRTRDFHSPILPPRFAEPAASPEPAMASDSDSDGHDDNYYEARTPATTYLRPTPSPVRSELKLPSLTNDFTRTFPAVPSSAALKPPENGWTSAWRWGEFGHYSDIRSTLGCADWHSDNSSDGASDRSPSTSPYFPMSELGTTSPRLYALHPRREAVVESNVERRHPASSSAPLKKLHSGPGRVHWKSLL